MSATIIDGKAIAREIQGEVAQMVNTVYAAEFRSGS